MSEEEEEIRRGSNSGIMPTPNYRSNNEIGLMKYVEFDNDLNEIRMEIPLENLCDPEENRKLRQDID